jgi:hypothetical protein
MVTVRSSQETVSGCSPPRSSLKLSAEAGPRASKSMLRQRIDPTVRPEHSMLPIEKRPTGGCWEKPWSPGCSR